MLDTGAYLSALASDSEAFADLAAEYFDRPVAGCPGWTVADLVGHLGGVYSWVVLVADAGGEKPSTPRDTAPADRAGLVSWFRERRAALLDALTRCEPDQPAWMFLPPNRTDIGWWRRRQAMETAVHLRDAEEAADAPGTIDPELAADGVDEYLTQFLPSALSRRPVAALSGTLHLHATDTPGEWSLDFTAPGVAVRQEHSKADTALRGPASGLFLWLWNRQDPRTAGLEVFGDTRVVDAWTQIQI